MEVRLFKEKRKESKNDRALAFRSDPILSVPQNGEQERILVINFAQ